MTTPGRGGAAIAAVTVALALASWTGDRRAGDGTIAGTRVPGAVQEWEGTDAFTLLRHDGRWRITSLAYAAD